MKDQRRSKLRLKRKTSIIVESNNSNEHASRSEIKSSNVTDTSDGTLLSEKKNQQLAVETRVAGVSNGEDNIITLSSSEEDEPHSKRVKIEDLPRDQTKLVGENPNKSNGFLNVEDVKLRELRTLFLKYRRKVEFNHKSLYDLPPYEELLKSSGEIIETKNHSKDLIVNSDSYVHTLSSLPPMCKWCQHRKPVMQDYKLDLSSDIIQSEGGALQSEGGAIQSEGGAHQQKLDPKNTKSSDFVLSDNLSFKRIQSNFFEKRASENTDKEWPEPVSRSPLSPKKILETHEKIQTATSVRGVMSLGSDMDIVKTDEIAKIIPKISPTFGKSKSQKLAKMGTSEPVQGHRISSKSVVTESASADKIKSRDAVQKFESSSNSRSTGGSNYMDRTRDNKPFKNSRASTDSRVANSIATNKNIGKEPLQNSRASSGSGVADSIATNTNISREPLQKSRASSGSGVAESIATNKNSGREPLNKSSILSGSGVAESFATNGTSGRETLQTSKSSTDSGTTESSSCIDSCPLCQMPFGRGMKQIDKDGHIAACFAASSDDVTW